MTPAEFVDRIYEEEDQLDDFKQELCNNFLFLMKHDRFLQIVVGNFWSYYKMKQFNRELLAILFYVVIFKLEEQSSEAISQMFEQLNFRFGINVLEYFSIEDNVVDITQAGCRIYDNEYVLENIVKPILAKTQLIAEVHRMLDERLKAKYAVKSKPPCTRPVTPTCSKRHAFRIPPTPVNSVVTLKKVRIKPISHNNEKTESLIAKAHENNRENAQALLDFARQHAFKCANTPKKIIPDRPELEPFRIKFSKIPKQKDVSVKGTTASLMREAATLVKDKETEIKKLEYLIQGGFDHTAVDVLEEEIRKYKEQQYLQEIERKHLQGLITYEESKLAKQNLLKENQARNEEFKKEREQILVEIEAWKLREQEKIRVLVEKCRSIEKGAREAEIKLQQNKRMQARMVDNETKDILREAYEKRQRELAEKVQLIQELRALQQVRALQVKEFDPTESPNFGFLCEMSIAELKERLGLLKLQMQEDLDKKRESILSNKKKQQETLDDVKRFVAESRTIKLKKVTKQVSRLEDTPELIALRQRLEQARESNRIRLQQ